jgi:hypothetical protein
MDYTFSINPLTNLTSGSAAVINYEKKIELLLNLSLKVSLRNKA